MGGFSPSRPSSFHPSRLCRETQDPVLVFPTRRKQRNNEPPPENRRLDSGMLNKTDCDFQQVAERGGARAQSRRPFSKTCGRRTANRVISGRRVLQDRGVFLTYWR